MTVTIEYKELATRRDIPNVGKISTRAESMPPKPQAKNLYVVVQPHNGGPLLHGHLEEGKNSLVLTPFDAPVRVHT